MATSAVIQPGGSEKGWLDRSLSAFAPVHSGEGVSALLLAANVFLLLAAYYIFRPVRESLILTEGGAEVKSYASAGQALLLLLVIPAYGAFASRVNRIRLITWVTLFFISHLLIFSYLGSRGTPVGVAFFLWVGIFNVLVIAQFWAFANDIYTEEQGKRLFAIVGVGASLGAWVGAGVAGMLFARLGPYQLMQLSAVVLFLGIAASQIVNTRETARQASKAQTAQEPLKKDGGFAMILRSRYLSLIAVLILLLNVVNTTGEFLLGKLVVQAADAAVAAGAEADALRRTFIGEFYGNFYSWVNLLAFLFQLFLVSRIFKYVGVRGALFVLPLIAMGGYGLLLAFPLLGAVRIAKVLENSTDYSIQNTTRHALFLPTSREAKYKAKAAIDTFFWRAGDVLQAGVVYFGTNVAAWNVAGFASMNLVFVAIWLVVVAFLYREHKRMTGPLAA